MTLRGKQLRQSGLIFICALLAGLAVPSGVLALSARDLVIVFNRNLPESREVAVYYAGKRRVPADNLVGVEVPASEDISRDDFDQKLAPPVREAVDKLKAQGRTPAILLVYGIPLRVGAAPLTAPELELKSLAIAKVKEYQAQAVQLVHQLDRLTGALTSPPPLTYPTPKFLEKSQDSLVRGKDYLDKQPATPATEGPGPRLRPS